MLTYKNKKNRFQEASNRRIPDISSFRQDFFVLCLKEKKLPALQSVLQ